MQPTIQWVKYKSTNNDLPNITQKTKDRATRTPLKHGDKTLVLRKGKQLPLNMWHQFCYCCYKPGDKHWMRKGRNCDYDQRNIFVIICDTDTLAIDQVMEATVLLSQYFRSKLCNDLAAEINHIKFNKYALEVNRCSTNSAVVGELGRCPLFLEVLFSIIK